MGNPVLTVGVLETGRPPEELPHSKDYPTLFAELLGVDPDLRFESWAALDGELPDSPGRCDAWLITGSKYGVYEGEEHPWIESAMDFVRAVWAERVPLVGICFGHQLIAQALGGRVEKSDRGWGVGVHDYQTTDAAPDWMAPADFAIQCLHQDQVVEVPPEATVVARNDFCPVAGLLYGDRAISFQGHPEFGTEYARELVTLRSELFGAATAEAALADIDRPIDSAQVAHWIVRFLRGRDAA